MTYVYFDDIETGTVLPSADIRIEADAVRDYRAALGLPEADDTVPPMYCVILMKELREYLPAPPGGIHAQQQFEFVEPMNVGDLITVESTISEKFLKNERRNVLITTTFTHEGQLLVRGTGRRIWAA
jgi:hypothetical protein